MTKSELEASIIEAARKMPTLDGYGCFNRTFEDLRVVIAEVMGYEVHYIGLGYYRHKAIKNPEDYDKVHTIIKGMENRKIIRFSRNGACFKLQA